jgi:pilus assembly protein CpaE
VNAVTLVTEMTLASARDTIRLLSWLKANAPHAQPLVVANKVQTGTAEISKADFEASIERKIDFTIPLDQKAAANAAKLGQTFAEANRSAKSGQTIGEVAKAIANFDEDGDTDTARSSAGTSLLGKFDLKSLLARKEKRGAAVSAE